MITNLLSGKRCLVTGGAGFLGRSLVRRLELSGAEVSGFGRVAQHGGQPIPWFGGTFSDTSALARAIEGQDFIFHLLGSSTPGSAERSPSSDLRENALCTVEMLELLSLRPGIRLVYASSGGTIYGPSGNCPVSESSATHPTSAYGAAKMTVESYLKVFLHMRGLDYKVLRIANPYGPNQSPTRKQGFIAAATYNLLHRRPVEIWGDGTAVRDYLYVDDVSDAFIAAAQHVGGERIFNIGSGQGRSLNEVVRDIGHTLGLEDAHVVRHPGRAVDLPVNILDITRASVHLGWQPRFGWPEGLSLTAKWLSDHYGVT